MYNPELTRARRKGDRDVHQLDTSTIFRHRLGMPLQVGKACAATRCMAMRPQLAQGGQGRDNAVVRVVVGVASARHLDLSPQLLQGGVCVVGIWVCVLRVGMVCAGVRKKVHTP